MTARVMSMDLPITSEDVRQECKKAADALIVYGAVLLRDSRVSEEDNSTFLDLLEDYFNQIGVTLENTEKPKCAVHEPCLHIIERLDPAERPLDISAHQPDPKCRFFWKMSEVPPYKTLWGTSMKTAVTGLAEMTAVGLDLPAKTFADAGRYGPHLLAPTASDLVKYGKKDTILAGFHTDLNFLTYSRTLSIPEGNYLLVQAGKQLEHFTGGLIKAGYHEVVVNENTLATIEKRRLQNPDRPLIRISSTFFWHLSSDFDLAPLPQLSERADALQTSEEGKSTYQPIRVGDFVSNELRHIALMA
ncbi:hypothetical protein F5887DRAFT_1178263 [Amanita rubescens]|nr:hypothetical protein F5887DRAFT_1178263 [Amanita rubescens]